MIIDESHYHVDSVELVGRPPIGDLTLRFTNGVNIIVGENGSGKSTLIEAIRTCRWPHGGSVKIHGQGSLPFHVKHARGGDNHLGRPAMLLDAVHMLGNTAGNPLTLPRDDAPQNSLPNRR
jgi:ABC-type transport system involved in cytochrome bd biosynthesis fused ATPase/permease subunit